MSCMSGVVLQVGHFGGTYRACMLVTDIVCLTIELTTYPCFELLLQKTFESLIYLFIYFSVCKSGKISQEN